MKNKPVELNDSRLLDEEEEYFEESVEKKSSSNKASAWLVSILVHALILGSLLYILMPGKEKMEDVIITTTPIPEIEEEPS